jgi:hypothetical protein
MNVHITNSDLQRPPVQAQLTTSDKLSLLPGVKILLQGPGGTGKTTALCTLAERVPEVFVSFTEQGLETFLGGWTDYGRSIPSNVHWSIMNRPVGGFDILAKAANQLNTYTLDALMKMTDPDKMKNNHFETFLKSLSAPKCDHCGKTFSPVDTWGPDRVFCIDSLSGINPIVFSIVIGNKAVRTQPEWGAAMDLLEKFIKQCTDGLKCHFILTAHIERELDEVSGGVKLMTSTLGRKLAPKLSPMFSDVILSVREGGKFSWSTANSQCDLKARNLPWADGIPPTFTAIMAKWHSRGGEFVQGVKK